MRSLLIFAKSRKNLLLIIGLLLIYFVLLLFKSNSGYLTIGDESAYANSVRALFSGFIDNNNHPLLAKTAWYLIILIFYLLTGTDYGWYWRIGTMIFSVGSIIVFYKIARLFFSKAIALICAALLALDPMFFALSRILMLDVPALFFFLISLWQFLLFYSKGASRYLFISGLCLGFSLAAKMFALPLVLVFPAIIFINRRHFFSNFNTYLISMVEFISFIILAYTAGNFIYFFKHSSVNFITYTYLQLMSEPGFGSSTGSLASPAWSWFIIPQILTIYRIFAGRLIETVVVMQSPILFLATIPALLLTILSFFFPRKQNNLIIQLLIIFLSLYLPWFLPIRSTYYYYVLPLIPLIIILFMNAIIKIKRLQNTIIIILISIQAALFVLFYPLLVGWGIPYKYEGTLKSYSLYQFQKRSSIYCQLCYPLGYPPIKNVDTQK